MISSPYNSWTVFWQRMKSLRPFNQTSWDLGVTTSLQIRLPLAQYCISLFYCMCHTRYPCDTNVTRRVAGRVTHYYHTWLTLHKTKKIALWRGYIFYSALFTLKFSRGDRTRKVDNSITYTWSVHLSVHRLYFSLLIWGGKFHSHRHRATRAEHA